MSDAIVWKDQALIDSAKPATHAVVIGVGAYPHLNGGTRNLAELHGGLGQLTSPLASAFQMAKWLLDEFNNPDRPLASLSLLVSDADAQPFEHPMLSAPQIPKEATSENIIAALHAWIALGDSNEENMTIFHFCGHGVARGVEGLTLLLSDYGKSRYMPMDGAIDFAAFHRGMQQCAAAYQCYFVDACRQVSNIARNTSEAGQKVIQDNINRPYDSDWDYLVLHSTVEGEQAYGRKGEPSFYTEELIRALSGTAANNNNADMQWRVNVCHLAHAVNVGLEARGLRLKNAQARQTYFDIHMPRNEPQLPVTVFCVPDDDHRQAMLSCLRDGQVLYTRPPAPDKWRVQLAAGSYNFQASISHRSGQRDAMVVPPGRDVSIKVAS